MTLLSSAAAAGDREDVIRVEQVWSHALAINDVRGIGEHASEDWVIATAEGTITTRATFLAVVASGDLVHDQMAHEPDTVRVYGDTAIVSGPVRSGGTWKGQRFDTHERSTDVFIKQGGRWRCVFTQLTALAAP